ncbi:MAG: lytic transglycosylase F [bacterium]|nr:lytic transglycosylase F [bacterium]
MTRRIFVLLMLLTVIPLNAWALENATPLIDAVKKKFTGDLAAMQKRGAIRVLIPFSRSFYFIQNGVEKGLAVEALREFEKRLNKGVKKEESRTRLVLIPTRRDKLISALVDGIGDISVANLTITKQRLEQVDFSDPFIRNVHELVVTQKGEQDYASIDDLAGLTIHVRKSASYFQSLIKANEQLSEKGLNPVEIIESDEWLEDEDLLEMVQAGSIPATIIDEHKAKSWLAVFDELKVHSKVPLRESANIGWAFRKNSPQLAKAINNFADHARQGTTFGNILIKRYYGKSDWIKNPKSDKYANKLENLMELFKKYGEKYNIDPLLLAALAFQESKFDNNAKSRVGAVGIMQILPSTAADKNVRIKNIQKLEKNIEAGAKYVRFMADFYFSEGNTPDIQKILMALASYNAGPNRIARERKKVEYPNQWFRNVEWQVARAVGSEPVRYVKNIYIYYVIFKSFAVANTPD